MEFPKLDNSQIRQFFRKKYTKVALLAGVAVVGAIVAFLILSNALVSPDGKYILDAGDSSMIQDKQLRVGLVLGAGITKQGQPFRELQARLDVAADAFDRGNVDALLLSGDNRLASYDEPGAMKKYLMEKRDIDGSYLHVDYAGRSTYESCERAHKVFGQNKLLIISANSHLPRAIYLCRHFGIEAYGLSSGVEANNSTRRESVARAKAVFNLYIHGENTLLGPQMKF